MSLERVKENMSGSVLSPDHEIRSFVAKRVNEGFDSEDDILEESLDYFADDFKDNPLELKNQLSKIISELIAEHLEEEKSWKTKTDCDRLDQAFADLEEQGIVCRQNFTCCQTCGHAEIWDEIELLKGELDVSGYVFYHMQDTDRVLEEGRLFLAYGASDNSDEATIRVAQKVYEVLTKNGFKLDWNGSLDKRICIEDLKWKRRRTA